MEANIAIHAPEKWAAAGDGRYDPGQKVKYIYSNRRKEREPKVSSKLQMKASKSYDNELESSVGKETDLNLETKTPIVQDDLHLNYGKRGIHPPNVGMGERAQDGSEVATVRPEVAAPAQIGERSLSPAPGHKKEKWKPKEKWRKSNRARHKGAATDSTKTGEGSSVDPVHALSASDKTIPVEFHLKEDQMITLGPAHQNKRPSTLSSSSDSLSLREKPSSLVILEVKDGPTFFYKPSNRMVSDSGIGDDSTLLSFGSPVVGSALRSEHMSGDSEKGSFTSFPSGYSSFNSSVDNSPFSAFRRNSSTGASSSVGHFTVSSSTSSMDGSPKSTQLPRPAGLRKPDLSVLNTPPRSRCNIPPNAVPVSEPRELIGESCLDRTGSDVGEKQPSDAHLAALPSSPTLMLPPPVKTLPVLLPASSSAETTGGSEHKEPRVVIKVPQSTNIGHAQSENPVPVFQALNGPDLDTSGFTNISEILQQKAGIKHDDIMVGPRRSKSGIFREEFDEIPVGPSKDIASVKYEDFLGANTPPKSVKATPLGWAVLSLETDSHPVLSSKNESRLKNDFIRGAGAVISHVDISDRPAYPTGKLNLYTEDGSKGRSLTPGPEESSVKKSKARGNTFDRSFKTQQVCVSDLSAPAAESSWEVKLKPKERKSGHQIPQRVKKDKSSGSSSDISKPSYNELGLKFPVDMVAYNTKSLDRNLRATGKAKPKSASASPAKHQQQLQSPKPRSSASTQTKKHAINPKLHMLSNIPVPICHDPPAKRNSFPKPQPLSDVAETTVPSPAYEKPSAAGIVEPFPQNKTKPESGSLETIPVSSSAQNSLPTNSNLSCRSGIPVRIDDKVSMNTDTASKTSATRNAKADTRNEDTDKVNQVVEDVMTDSKADRQEAKMDLPSTPPVTDSEITTDSSQIPVKPRLHRSAEHLFGNAQLTVFNSTDNIQHFENTAGPSDKRTFKPATKPEKADSDHVSPLKKTHGLAKIGIMRRGSDRTETYRRGSERAVLPINRNDPSVEDLKKATSLKELCHSVASLLNIDNERAAEMITTSLSQRQDLVEGLDADAILDYLSHHGVLDPAILVGLDDKATIKQRNSAILRHVEEHGNTAVALFINALRQSGQLHLASSLDTEQRIKPVSGNGYFGKDRHKGEVTIRVEIEALKIIAPREPRTDKIVDASLLASPSHTGDELDGVVVKDDTDEDDVVKPRSCWCFCISRKSSKAKSASKKEMEKKKKMLEAAKLEQLLAALDSGADTRLSEHEEVDKKDPHVKPHRTKSKDKNKKKKEKVTAETAASENNAKAKDPNKTKEKDSGKKSKGSKAKSKTSGKSTVPEIANGSESHNQLRPGSLPEGLVKSGKNETAVVDKAPQNGAHGVVKSGASVGDEVNSSIQQQYLSSTHQPFSGGANTPGSSLHGPKSDKDNWDPIIMEYNPKLELVKLRAGQEELASPTRQTGNIGIMCEQWKSNGRHFLQKASQLCDRIIQLLQTEIIKYFEQDRGTLVLDVISDSSAILIVNICMKRVQVKRLLEEASDESLLNKLQGMFFSKVDISDFDIRGVKLGIVLNEQEVGIALSELS